ncbi:preprotein translocase subunit SecG [Fibrobacter sp. UWB16]|uniref:preprotein translocase subunit SecG n=1 Tax=unclassified Fibrobacter TaxID=2634177 RepID=UPI000B52762D|nr:MULTISPECIES: preprotein translocase subunit SecG [unclassified Fibrobacter]MBP5440652.1 preprotein translocase subunit SecG [Fibrobacter sp.]OWV15802.1 preprotein translocase subunit SecG [Fibrobacter sp. UWB3]SOD12042.1 preprotein translocase subunit SecG [Fibrobacter sp. UWB16]
MTTLFWVLIVLHVFLCFFLALLVLVQNDKMGGLAGLGGMTSQSAFSTAGAATFIQKLTRVVAVIFFIVVFALGLITAKQDQTVEESAMQKATRESAAEQAVPEVPALPATFNAPAEVAPAAPAAEVKAEAPAAPAAEVKAEAAPAPEAAAPAEAPKAKKGKKKAK